jgi:hypothetical protein
MKTTMNILILAFFVLTGAAAPALSIAEGNSIDTWQRQLLFNPTAEQRERENRGHIFIYEGLRDTDINQALETQFHRVQSMMFVRTVMTDDRGLPKTDLETGGPLIHDDGCD